MTWCQQLLASRWQMQPRGGATPTVQEGWQPPYWGQRWGRVNPDLATGGEGCFYYRPPL